MLDGAADEQLGQPVVPQHVDLQPPRRTGGGDGGERDGSPRRYAEQRAGRRHGAADRRLALRVSAQLLRHGSDEDRRLHGRSEHGRGGLDHAEIRQDPGPEPDRSPVRDPLPEGVAGTGAGGVVGAYVRREHRLRARLIVQRVLRDPAFGQRLTQCRGRVSRPAGRRARPPVRWARRRLELSAVPSSGSSAATGGS